MRKQIWNLAGAWILGLAATAWAQEPALTQATSAEKEQNPMVTIKTSHGDIMVELNNEKSPVTVENFLKYVDDGHYAGTIFHRVIEGFMIQGGGFAKDFAQKQTREPIVNEAKNGLKNARGTLAMARTSDPNSATAQFFINVVDNAGLDHPNPDGHGYAVFGKVTEGMDVVDKIRAVPTGMHGQHRDVPREPVEILSIVRGAD